MLLAATLGMVGCTDDDIVNSGNGTAEDSGKYAYINTAISLPSSGYTRSQTDMGQEGGEGNTNSNATEDHENAYDYESEVRSMILVIANENDEYLAHTVVPSIAPIGTTGTTNNPTYLVNSKIPYDILEKAYTEKGVLGKTQENLGESDIKINLYAYCNYTSDLLADFDEYAEDQAKDTPTRKTTEWIDWSGTVEEAPAAAGKPKPTITNTIWAKRSFLMTNYANYMTDKFPASIDGWDAYANQSNALDLTMDEEGVRNPLKVERVAARFDFKDGSFKKISNANGEIVNDPNYKEATYNNTYQLWTTIPAEGTDKKTENKNYFSVQLTRMALVNMSKNFYYLRRVSNDGMPKTENQQNEITNGWKVGGNEYYQEITGSDGKVERAYNYVVDTDAEAKQTVEGITPGKVAGEHFNFCLYDEDSKYDKDAWYADNISDVLKEGTEMDQWNSQSTYHIWRYVTENTIPESTDTDHPESQQKTIQSTGIVFKGAIVAGDNSDDEDSKLSQKVKDALAEAAKPKDERNKNNLPILYSFDNILYAGMEELIENAFKEGENSPFYQAVDNILTKHWAYKEADGKVTYTFSKEPIDVEAGLDSDATEEERLKAHENDLTVTLCHYILNNKKTEGTDEYYPEYKDYTVDLSQDTETAFCKLVPKQKITVYEATDEGEAGDGIGAGLGYYCYYFYWNRHNDNQNSGKMGPMEFAVVRNNVYKLSVSAINQLGHPRDTEHDPDPVDPEDPDEDPTRYIKVDVQVLPWVVRVNDITF